MRNNFIIFIIEILSKIHKINKIYRLSILQIKFLTLNFTIPIFPLYFFIK
jgi:hypothetical protein